MDPRTYLSSLKPLAIRLGLGRMERAVAALGHPERAFPVLHVAGTNGKGSTCAMSAEALRRAGHLVGLYTSPHLVRFGERIQVDGQLISDEELGRAVAAVRAACPWHDAGSEDDRLTFFEFATLLAFVHFAERRVDVAVVEVGLGGRFDATNVVRPAVTAVSRIGLDHEELLGGTLSAIAGEKAGIFKPGVPAVVAAAQPPEAMARLRSEAASRGAPFHVAAEGWDGLVALRGPHQSGNAALAAAALRLLAAGGVAVPEEAITAGIATARWPGRLEEVGGVLLDGAHNPDGAAALAAALRALHPGRAVELVFGVLADKDHRRILAALAPLARGLHLVAPASPRARPPEDYATLARAFGPRVDVHASCREALDCARAAAADGALVCAAGSLYLVGEARQLLGG
ncbi:bifunctional folylpolyglutamate synthase/dihydrofolate synthase [Anaeromyxobacter paludicola]|uniref:Dihydrofolate synthase/folylpolyglutamate synthase n=1 Tax=Anaeromyxobacter paludicola TaxID=2918171 RepID=A0ABN6N4H3_9BACT|nr:folylpolyglutamate synthase/dihydrofolate synthase family protein [Anaeromyxobacter paludicola]BDG08097.1 bifunctional folylpolyglutamate synthase/dihydrofolate synthase [Anaeromyxobacter paludicola]